MTVDAAALAPPPGPYRWWHNDVDHRWEIGTGEPGPLWAAAGTVDDEWTDSALAELVATWLRHIVRSVTGTPLVMACDGCGFETVHRAHQSPGPTPMPPPCPRCGGVFEATA